ncbi:MAG: SufD family Fe-S cluster assembly protein [Eubacteriales bacterium]|nr:SufD family Fe-S cluster assembly protein [Eubacteriales bacterium]
MNIQELNPVARELLNTVEGYEGAFEGAYNIRQDSGCAGRRSTDNIRIESKPDGKPGLEIHVAAGTRDETVYIPAVVTHGDIRDVAYNDFYIGAGAQVKIVAGCGVHTSDESESRHDGIHRFYLSPGSDVMYEEKHVGTGEGQGIRRINPVTECWLEEDASLTMDTSQLGGVSFTERETHANLKARSRLIIRERLLTDGSQEATSVFHVVLEGEDAGCDLVSRSVAKGHSRQHFVSRIVGEARCHGHSACDAIVADEAVVTAAPRLDALSPDAALIHEAAIGKIAGEQILKLRTLGLSEEEAEARIVAGFLK